MPVDYSISFSNLRTDTSASRWSAKTCYHAPYKPFLLLAIMDLISQGIVQRNFIEFNADLMDVFDLYWDKIMGAEKRSNLVLPFFHLQSDKFWHLVPVPGKEEILAHTSQIRSIGPLRQLVLGATFDESLFELLQNAKTRDDLRRVLIETYFAPEVRPVLVELGQISAEAFQYSLQLLDRSKRRFRLNLKDSKAEYNSASRSTAFRRVVMQVYNYTCAMSQLHVLTPEGRSAVVAAHIVPWSESYNDDPRNGLALSPLCHWGFDEGLLTIAPDYRILVSPVIPSDEKGAEPLLLLDGKELQLPKDHTIWPAKSALKWHRENIFRAEVPPRLF